MGSGKRPVRILIADDDPSILRLLQVNFGLEGFEVESVIRGNDVLPRAKEFDPDVILLDVMMPEVDGWEVCRRLRADDETAEIPIIFLSAKAQDEDRIRGRDLGAEYVSKPFDAIQLAELVRRSARTAS